jgi:hypothetical protein
LELKTQPVREHCATGYNIVSVSIGVGPNRKLYAIENHYFTRDRPFTVANLNTDKKKSAAYFGKNK